MYARKCRNGDEFRSSLHCVDRVDVLPQRPSNDDGCRLIHLSRSDYAMLNRSKCWVGDGPLDGNLDGMVQSGVEGRSPQVVFRVTLSREWVWMNQERYDLGRHRVWQHP